MASDIEAVEQAARRQRFLAGALLAGLVGLHVVMIGLVAANGPATAPDGRTPIVSLVVPQRDVAELAMLRRRATG